MLTKLRCALGGHEPVKYLPAIRWDFGSFYGEGDPRNVLYHEWRHIRSCDCGKSSTWAMGIPYCA